MINKILMCPPKYFQIEYEINPWMSLDNQVDQSKAMQEYLNLKATYESLGYEVEEVNPVEGLPDMVYVNNNGHAQNGMFVRGALKYEQRQGETDYVEEYFAKNNYKLIRLSEGCIFEGQGDLLRTQNKYFFGHGKRSNLQARSEIEQALDVDLIDLELTDPYYYHLNMCFCPIRDDLVVISPDSFTSESLAKIRDSVRNVIEVNEQDNQFMACNSVKVGDRILATKGMSDSTKEKLEDLELEVIELDMTEIMKGGGSIKCLSMLIFD